MSTNGGRINYTVGFNVDSTQLNNLQTQLQNLKALTANGIINGTQQDVAELQQVQNSISQVEQALNRAFNQKLGTLNITQFNNQLKSLDLSRVQADFAKLGSQGTVAFRNIAAQALTTNVQLKQSHTMLQSIATTFANTVKWSIASTAINSVTTSVRKAYSYVKELDESLNNIMLVTDKSADSMEKFAKQANKAAKNLGATTTEYTNASLIYYQQGLNDAETAARTETTLKAANVTKQSADAVSEQLTAVWNGYKVSAQETELYVDKLAKVASTTAADLEELSVGMSRVASAANLMGVDIDQLNAQLATIISVTREAPETIGTSLKTIYARMSDIQAGLDEETTLGEYTQGMADLGFNVLDANNKLRNMGEVVEEIGGKWNTLNREQQVSLAQTMAGTRQYSRLLSLFDNWSMYEKSLQTSANSMGFLQQQQDEYMDSMEAHLAQLQAATEEAYSSLIDNDAMNTMVDGLTLMVNLLNSFISNAGGGMGVLVLLTNTLSKVFINQLSQGLTTMVLNLQASKNQMAQLTAEQELLVQFSEVEESVIKKVVDEKQKILSIQKSLTQEELNSFNGQLKELVNLENKKTLLEEQLQLAEQYASIATGGTADSSSATGRAEMSKVLLSSSKEHAALGNSLYGLSSSTLDIGQQIRYQAVDTSKGTETYQSLVTNTKAVRDVFEGDLGTQNLSTLQTALGGIDSSAYKDLIKDLETIGFRTDEATGSLKSFRKINFDSSKEVVALGKVTKTLGTTFLNISKQEASFSKNLNNLNSDLDRTKISLNQLKAEFKTAFAQAQIKAQIQGVMQGFQGLASGIMGVTMAMNSLNTVFDEDASNWERFSAFIMGIGMGLPMISSGLGRVIQGFQSFSAARKAATVAQAAGNEEDKEAIALSGQEAAAESAEAAASTTSAGAETAEAGIQEVSNQAEVSGAIANTAEATAEMGDATASVVSAGAETVETAATEKNTAANWANAASQFAKLGIIGLIIAAVVALIAVIVMLTKGEDEETAAMNRANEALANASTRYDEATAAVNRFKETLSNYEEGKKALEDLDSTTEAYKEKLEEVNAQAKELIETYGLFDDYSIDAVTGAITIDDKALKDVEKGLEEQQTKASISKLMAEMHVISAQLDVDSKNASKSVGSRVSYTAYDGDGNAYTAYRQMSNDEMQSLGKAMSELKKETNNVELSEEQLIKKLKENRDEYDISSDVYNNLNDIINNNTINGLWHFVETLETASEANLQYAKQILKTVAEDVYGDAAHELATDEETGETDAVLENLLIEAAGAAAARSEDEAGKAAAEKAVEWTEKARDIIDDHDSNWDAQDDLEDDLADFASDLGLNVNDVQKTMFGYDGKNDVQAHTLYKRYLESQGYENVVTSDKSGKVEYAYTDPNSGEQKKGTISNELAGESYAQEFTATAIQMASEKITKNAMSEEDFLKIGENVRDVNNLYGADWTNVLLSSAATGKNLDLSSLFGQFTQAEVDELKSLSGEALQTKLNLSDEAMTMLNLTHESLNKQVNASLEDYDAESHRKAADAEGDKRAEKLGLDVEELDAYRKILAEENEELAENRQALNDVAIANKRMEKGVKTLAGDWESLDEIMSDSTSTAEDISSVLPTVNEGLQDILNLSDEQFELLPPNFAKDNWNLIQDVMNGVEGAVDRLRDVAGQEILLDVKGAVDANGEVKKGVSRLHEYIASMDGENFEIGVAINDEEFLARCQEIVNAAEMTKDQASAYFASMGYDVEFSDNPQKVQEQVVDLTYNYDFDDEGNPIKRYATPEYRKVETEIDAPTIKTITPNGSYGGNTSVKTTAPKTATSAAKSGGGSSKSKKKEKKTINENPYRTVDSKLKQAENDLIELEREREKLSGGKILTNLNKQLSNIKQQVQLQKEKLEIAKQEEQRVRNEILTAGNDDFSFGIQFDAEGNITNYDEIAKQELAKLNAAEEAFNKSAQEDADQEALEKARERYEAFTSLIEEYDEIHDSTIFDIEQSMQDLYDEMISLQVEKFRIDIDLGIKLTDAKIEWNDFKKELLYDENDLKENFELMFDNLTSIIDTSGEGMLQDTLNKMQEVSKEIDIIRAGGESSIFGNNETLATETWEELYQQAMTYAQSAQDFIESIEDAIEAAEEKIVDLQQQSIDSYERMINTYEHLISVKELLGGDDVDTTEYSQKMLTEQIAQLKELQAWLNDPKNQLDESLKETDLEKYIEDANAILDKQEEMQAAVQSAIETANVLFEKSLTNIVNNLEDSFTNNLSWDRLSTQWENDAKLAEVYLSSVNKEYEMQKLINKIEEDLLDTQYDSLYAQKMINQFKNEELNILLKKDKLTEAEVKRANQLYELTLLQIALEEARNNKSSMKLKRDSQGNYTYQYVADQEAIAKAEQELANKQNEIYNENVENITSTIENYKDAGQSLTEDLNDILESEDVLRLRELQNRESLTDEEKQEMEMLRKNLYNDIAEAVNTNGSLMNSFKDNTITAANNLFKDLGMENVDLNNLTEEQQKILAEEGLLDSLKFVLNSENISTEELYDSVISQLDSAYDKDAANIDAIMAAYGVSSLDEYYSQDELIAKYTKETRDNLQVLISDLASDLSTLSEQLANDVPAIKKELEKLFGENGTFENEADKYIGNMASDLAEIKGELVKEATAPPPSNPTPPSNPSPAPSAPSTPQGNGSPDVGDTVTFVSGKYWSNSGLTGTSGSRGLGKSAKITQIAANGKVHIQAVGGAYGWVDISQISGYNTGGYTGQWFNGSKDGRLAWLHQKELILNEQDTPKILDAVKLVREMTTGSIISDMQKKMNNLISNLENDLIGTYVGLEAAAASVYTNGQALEQQVHIDATFPNVKDAKEIEAALNNLVNVASQYATEDK